MDLTNVWDPLPHARHVGKFFTTKGTILPTPRGTRGPMIFEDLAGSRPIEIMVIITVHFDHPGIIVESKFLKTCRP